MKNRIFIYIGILTPFLFLSCSETLTKTEEKKVNKEGSLSQSEITPIDSVTEKRYAFIKEFEKSNSDLYIKVDFVDYLTGQEAVDAEWRDEAYFVDGQDTLTNITDGYYISNVNPKIRTFKILENLSVKHIIDDDGVQNMPKSKSLDSKQLENYIEQETLVFLHIKNGIIKRIDERFMP